MANKFERIRGVKCIKCGKHLMPKDFSTPDRMKEFLILGLCEPCQLKGEKKSVLTDEEHVLNPNG